MYANLTVKIELHVWQYIKHCVNVCLVEHTTRKFIKLSTEKQILMVNEIIFLGRIKCVHVHI